VSAHVVHHQASALALLLSFAENYWWLALIFGSAVAGWVSDSLESARRALSNAARRHHKRRLARLRLELKVARAGAVTSAPAPGECRHRNITSVRDRQDTIVAWLCRSCDTQLPATWSTCEDDL
jgi:hypothetical protein